jgi:hypothetical protein
VRLFISSDAPGAPDAAAGQGEPFELPALGIPSAINGRVTIIVDKLIVNLYMLVGCSAEQPFLIGIAVHASVSPPGAGLLHIRDQARQPTVGQSSASQQNSPARSLVIG